MSARRRIGVCLASGEHILASFGFLIPSFRAALAEQHDLRVLPEYVYQLAPETRTAVLERFVQGLDLLYVWHPRYPSFLRTLMQARRRHAPRMPVIYAPLGELPMGAGWFRPSMDLFGPGDRILPSCATDLQILETLFSDLGFPAEVFPFWVDTDHFRPPEKDLRAEARADFGLEEDDVAFVYAGRITAEKNVHAILHLFTHLAAELPQVRLLLAGPIDNIPFLPHTDGPRDVRGDLIGLIKATPALAGRTVVLGERYGHDCLRRIFAAADVFVNLTLHHNENFGLANVEAMASGLPAIVSDWGGPRDTVLHGQTGYRVSTYQGGRGEYVDLWQAYLRCRALATDASLRQRLGRAARRHADETYALRDLPGRLAAVVEHTLIAPRGEGPSPQLSDFGTAFHRAFHAEDDYDFLPRFSAETMPLYRKLIRPYCTRGAPGDLDGQSRLFLSTPMVSQTEADRIELVDMVWPGTLPVTEPAERVIVAALHGRGFASPQDADMTPCGDGGAALRALMRCGAVVQGRPLDESPRQAG